MDTVEKNCDQDILQPRGSNRHYILCGPARLFHPLGYDDLWKYTMLIFDFLVKVIRIFELFNQVHTRL